MLAVETATPSVGLARPRWGVTSREKTKVQIRPVREQDSAAERVFMEALSLQAHSNRLGEARRSSEIMIDWLAHVDDHQMAFAAVVDDGGVDRIVGISRYSISPDSKWSECAIAVLDDWRKKGLCTVLMKHLIDVAKGRGIQRLWSLDAAANVEMGNLSQPRFFERSEGMDDAIQVIPSLWL